MIESVVNNILTHTRAHFPEEACGLVAIRKGKTKFYPCENKAADPLIDFSIDPKEYRKVSKEADIIGIIHNHPQGTASPSPLDKAVCNKLGIPWYIFDKDESYTKIEPENTGKLDLIGREFVFGAYDCFTIIQDYFEELEIYIEAVPYDWEFWEKGHNLYVDNYTSRGFHRIIDGSLKIHDVILMAVGSDIANHAGIYVGDFKILHHAPYRLSCRDNYNGIWKQHTRDILRHERFL